MVIALATALQESRLRVYANDGLGDDLAPEQEGIAASQDCRTRPWARTTARSGSSSSSGPGGDLWPT